MRARQIPRSLLVVKNKMRITLLSMAIMATCIHCMEEDDRNSHTQYRHDGVERYDVNQKDHGEATWRPRHVDNDEHYDSASEDKPWTSMKKAPVKTDIEFISEKASRVTADLKKNTGQFVKAIPTDIESFQKTKDALKGTLDESRMKWNRAYQDTLESHKSVLYKNEEKRLAKLMAKMSKSEYIFYQGMIALRSTLVAIITTARIALDTLEEYTLYIMDPSSSYTIISVIIFLGIVLFLAYYVQVTFIDVCYYLIGQIVQLFTAIVLYVRDLCTVEIFGPKKSVWPSFQFRLVTGADAIRAYVGEAAVDENAVQGEKEQEELVLQGEDEAEEESRELGESKSLAVSSSEAASVPPASELAGSASTFTPATDKKNQSSHSSTFFLLPVALIAAFLL